MPEGYQRKQVSSGEKKQVLESNGSGFKSSCVTLGKAHHLSEPQFSHSENKDGTFLSWCGEDYWTRMLCEGKRSISRAAEYVIAAPALCRVRMRQTVVIIPCFFVKRSTLPKALFPIHHFIGASLQHLRMNRTESLIHI